MCDVAALALAVSQYLASSFNSNSTFVDVIDADVTIAVMISALELPEADIP